MAVFYWGSSRAWLAGPGRLDTCLIGLTRTGENRVDIDALGVLAVSENGVPITPSAPKPRQVLAMLALHADQVVSVPSLFEELWGQEPPRSARTTLQTYILQLREAIAGALTHDAHGGPPRTAKDVLVTTSGGYLLRTSGGASDVRRFETLAG